MLDNQIYLADNIIIVKDKELLKLIEQIIREKLSIRLEYDDLRRAELNTSGGAFLFKKQRYIVVHKHLPLTEKIATLLDILADLDIDPSLLPEDVAKRIGATARSG